MAKVMVRRLLWKAILLGLLVITAGNQASFIYALAVFLSLIIVVVNTIFTVVIFVPKDAN